MADRQFIAPGQQQASHREAVTDAASVLRVAYVLAYRAPDYIRTESLLKALSACPNVQLSVARNTTHGLGRYIETWRAVRRLRAREAPDVYVLGFRGHEFFWAMRWLSGGKPLLFDALMSPYAALHDERKTSVTRRALAWLLYPLERSTLRHADIVLTDTQLHAEFYAREFGVSTSSLCAVPIGAIDAPVTLSENVVADREMFRVLFYGSFLPLHGIDVILEATKKLVDLPIHFDFVGGTTTHKRQLQRAFETRDATTYSHRSWVPFEDLLALDIPMADLVLGGPFGDTPQARRVVTGKAVQALALGRATVIGCIDEEYGFVDQHNCLLVKQADSMALAQAIRWAFDHRDQLPMIGKRGRQLFAERFSTIAIMAALAPALERLTNRVKA